MGIVYGAIAILIFLVLACLIIRYILVYVFGEEIADAIVKFLKVMLLLALFTFSIGSIVGSFVLLYRNELTLSTLAITIPVGILLGFFGALLAKNIKNS